MPQAPLTITALLFDVTGVLAPFAKVRVQLCGFGSQIPRVAGTGFFPSAAPVEEIANAEGAVSFALYGNDAILPAGTYYTVTMLDANGNAIQTNAYQFTGGGSFDLSTVTPYNPNPVFPPNPSPIAPSGPAGGGAGGGGAAVRFMQEFPTVSAGQTPVTSLLTLTHKPTSGSLNVYRNGVLQITALSVGGSGLNITGPQYVVNGSTVVITPNAGPEDLFYVTYNY